ncbi:hypothetical protein V6N13_072164 [Hibiscus sabdariffa]
MTNEWFGRVVCLQLIRKEFHISDVKNFLVKLKKVKTALKAWHGAKEDLNDKVILLEKRINEIVLREDFRELNHYLIQELLGRRWSIERVYKSKRTHGNKKLEWDGYRMMILIQNSSKGWVWRCTEEL